MPKPHMTGGTTEMISSNLQCFRASGKMTVPQGGGHVRSVEFSMPGYKSDPVVSATVYPVNSEGNSFTIYGIRINHPGNETRVVVDAAWTLSGTVDIIPGISEVLAKYDIRCDLLAYGEPRIKVGKKRRKR